MHLFQIVILAAIQGAAELLPVSSSAHVILAEKMMGLDPGAPQMTFLLVMLHTGTMFAVLFYFWKRWKALLQSDSKRFIRAVLLATAVTGAVGLALKVFVEKIILEKMMGHSHGEVEELFRHMPLIAANLLLVGVLIIYAGYVKKSGEPKSQSTLADPDATAIGLIQAICLPLRGFSRSGATISAALIRSIPRQLAEDFSFALAVLLTPPVILLEVRRLFKATESHAALHAHDLVALFQPGMIGMIFSFIAGLLALKWLSHWLEAGKWQYFGYYCLVAGTVVAAMSIAGIA